jgi:hypothetical protein
MSMRSIAGSALLLAVALAVPLAVNAQDTPDGVALSRVEKSFGLREWNCIDPCGGYSLRVSTPADVEKVDLVVTATFVYRIEGGFRAKARLGWATGTPPAPVPCCGDEPSTALKPGRYPLQSTAGKAATRTMSWIATNLPASGTEYRLYLNFETNAPPIEGNIAKSSKAVLVAEVWSAGHI